MTGVNDASEALAHYLASNPDVTDYCVGYSGGLDSHVLLHVAHSLLAELDNVSFRAVHVDHGQHPDSARWVDHCRRVCGELGIEISCHSVTVEDVGDGPEASARMARYGVFSDHLRPGEHLLLAQHADDQAETFLLQALRGSGPDGLASIPRKRTFASGILARPLLGCSQQALCDYADLHALDWVDDPSNQDTRFDRNFLRLEVLPLLRSRWPSAAQTLGRSALRSAAASQTLLELAREDLALVRIRGATELSVSELRALPRERGYNVMRYWVRQAGLRMPRLQDLSQVWSDLLQARTDSVGIVNCRDYEFRRHRDRLYVLPPQAAAEAFEYHWQPPFADLHIPEIGLTLSGSACAEQGIVLPNEDAVVVRSRQGGELIKLGEPAFHKAVKKVLQEAAVPPWQRDSIPLLYVHGRLAAVWNVAVAVDFRTAQTPFPEPA